MSTLTTQRQILLVFAGAVAARLAFHIYTGFTADDAFITFRYADNLASGLGLVYNEGERVLGTTTPLFTFLIAIFRLISFPPQSAALLISVIATGISAILLFRLAQSLRFRNFAVIPAILYILVPRSLAAETSGMEAALFTMFITAAIFYHHRHLYYYSLALATLSLLTRPEGIILLIILGIDLVWKKRSAVVGLLAIPITLLLPWVLFAGIYYGSLIPHSIQAKLVLYDLIDTPGPLERFIFVTGWHHPLGWLLTAAAIIGAYWLNKKQNFGWIPIFWILGLIAFYTVSNTKVFFWYLAPLYPMYLLLASAVLPLAADRLNLSPSTCRGCGVAATLVTIVALIGLAISPAREYRNYQAYLEDTHKEIGLYLYRQAKDTDLVAAEDIGYIGYYSELKVLDRDGLVSRATVPYLRAENPLQLILDYDPDWVVTAEYNPLNDFVDSESFRQRFQPVSSFRGDRGPEYTLWRTR